MAQPLAVGVGRPNLPGHRSFNDYGECGKPSAGSAVAPIITYEGYNITPRDPEYNDGKGRFYRAPTKSMPATQRELESLIQKQSRSDCTAIQELYSYDMKGSKRDHIEAFIRARNAQDPERKHELAYLKAQRGHRSGRSKHSGKRTMSIQIILECRFLPRNIQAPIFPTPPNRGLNTAMEGLITPEKAHSNSGAAAAIPAAMTSRPQYLPPYVQQRALKRTGTPNNGLPVDNETGRKASITSTSSSSSDESGDSEDFFPSSPTSIQSSKTITPSSWRTSASSGPTSSTSAPSQIVKDEKASRGQCTAIGINGKQNDERRSLEFGAKENLSQPSSRQRDEHELAMHTQPFKGMVKSNYSDHRPVPQPKYASIGTQTDQQPIRPDPGEVFSAEVKNPEQNLGMVKPVEDKSSSGRKDIMIDEAECEEEFALHNAASNSVGSCVKGTNEQPASSNLFEKPEWMNNLQPGARVNDRKIILNDQEY